MTLTNCGPMSYDPKRPSSVAGLLGLSALLLVLGQPLRAAETGPCEIGFDNTLQTSHGQLPLISQGVRFVPGHVGEAVMIPQGGLD